MSVIRLSNAILLPRSPGKLAESAPAIFLFLKEIASANRAILYTYPGRGFALMDAVVFAAATAGAGARAGSTRTRRKLRLQLLLPLYIYMSAYV